jgi:hypothetical protein
MTSTIQFYKIDLSEFLRNGQEGIYLAFFWFVIN